MYAFSLASAISVLSLGVLRASAYDNSRSDNLAVYWGQNSYGATHLDDTANWQQRLSTYCQDDVIDVIPVAFLNVFFSTGGEPSLDLANICNTADDSVFSGTSLPDCSFLQADIELCQSKGKLVTLSLGGATGAASFSSDQQASDFGDTLWNLFLGGTSSTRPFGSAVLDGIDIDIEGGGTTYFATMVNRIRTLATGASKQYYVTGAPQCPYPDAYMSTVLNAAEFDAVYVQFYSNYCGVINYNVPNDWDFSEWDTWAKTVSLNPNVKIYIGAPAAPTASSGYYVDSATLINIALATRSQYSSFGGVMLWDASQAYANGRYDQAIKNGISEGSSTTTSVPVTVSTPTSTSTSVSTTTTATTTSIAPPTTTTQTSTTTFSGSCGGIASWVANVAYVGGSQVVYNGHLWTAKYWSYGDVPGGTAGDWTDDGVCASFAVQIQTARPSSTTA